MTGEGAGEAEGGAAFFAPGCEHLECHNRTAMDYADGYATSWPGAQRAKFFFWPSLRVKRGRRWCISHALLNEGVAFG